MKHTPSVFLFVRQSIRIVSPLWLAAVLLAGIAPRVHAAGGDFDTSFSAAGNPAGIARFVASGTESRGSAMLVTENGAVFIAGQCVSGANYDVCVSKRNFAGGADSAFGGGSGTMTIVGMGISTASAMTRDAQGNLWVGGICAGNSCVFKVSSSGGLFINVGSNGLVTVPDMRWVQAMAMTPEGKILVGGVCTQTGAGLPCLGRLLPNGTFDPAFNGGSVWVWSTLRGGEVRTLIQRSNGAVYVGATCDTGTSSAVNRMCYADISAAGTVTSTYMATVPNSTAATLGGMVLASDGALVASGTCVMVTTGAFRGCMFRFKPGTGIDTTFGTSGYVNGVNLGQTSTSVYDLMQREDGSLIMVTQCMASTTPFQRYGICLAAFDANGVPSAQFGGQTTRLLDTEPQPVGGSSLASWLGDSAALTGDGKLVTVGACFAGVSSPQSCVARIQLENPQGTRCTADIDGSNTVNATSDGVMLMRMLLGLSGNPAIFGALSANASRLSWPAVRDYAGLHCRVPVAP
jgi:hypothetical protein